MIAISRITCPPTLVITYTRHSRVAVPHTSAGTMTHAWEICAGFVHVHYSTRTGPELTRAALMMGTSQLSE